ncbi:MAG: serine/threonine-protein kinase [Limisphaerales bacterium]
MTGVETWDSDTIEPEPHEFGPYRLEEMVNRGGFSEIWLARHPDHRTVAVRKLINTSLFNFSERSRFFHGCEILQKLQGREFIIGYIEHGRIAGCPFLAMEYLEASNLKLILARCDDLLQEYLGNILIDSARALENVHDAGFMHLDFKPENLLVSRNANVRLIDFDLAQPRPEEPRKSGKNPGTPAYMSPEQLQRLPFDHRTDIFAFGVTAFETVTLEKPFPGDSPDEILRRQLDRSDFRTPCEINPAIPPALDKLILRCLETDPSKRYPFLSVVVRDLERALYV